MSAFEEINMLVEKHFDSLQNIVELGKAGVCGSWKPMCQLLLETNKHELKKPQERLLLIELRKFDKFIAEVRK